MKTIVLGATGLVGAHLVKQLSACESVSQVLAITRRPLTDLPAKVESTVVDFNRLDDYAEVFTGDALFSCLGTTLKQAGSIAAQRMVDFDYQYQAAKLASQAGVEHYLLVSSSGANANSASPYLKMKGELEVAVRELNFKHLSIVQPSLLLGSRAEKRSAEGLAAMILPTLCKLPGLQRYRPIHGSQVAKKLLELSINPTVQFQRLSLQQVFPKN